MSPLKFNTSVRETLSKSRALFIDLLIFILNKVNLVTDALVLIKGRVWRFFAARGPIKLNSVLVAVSDLQE